MRSITVQSRISPELKELADRVFSGMGMTTADAIRIFIQQTVNEGGLPFRPYTKIPNSETLASMQEAEGGNTTRYQNADALFKDLGI